MHMDNAYMLLCIETFRTFIEDHFREEYWLSGRWVQSETFVGRNNGSSLPIFLDQMLGCVVKDEISTYSIRATHYCCVLLYLGHDQSHGADAQMGESNFGVPLQDKL